MSTQMLAPQTYFRPAYFVMCIPARPLAWAPPGGTQPVQVTSQSVDAKTNMSEQFWDEFDGSTPEPSPRTWQGSQPPSPLLDLYPFMASKPLGDNCFAVDAQKIFPMASMGPWNNDYSSGVQQAQEPEPTTGSLFQEPDQEFTLVARNIPARYTPAMLLAEFWPDATFNLLILPYSFKDQKTMGCAYINFRSRQLSAQFQEKWHRQFLRNHRKTKHFDITAASFQGLGANLAQFNEKSVARLQRAGMLPIFLGEAGEPLDAIDELRKRGIISGVPVRVWKN